MTVLIASFDSNGCNGRCDAKCYNARRTPDCDCICGGKNHGAGLDKALDNTKTNFRAWAEAWKARHKDTVRIEVPVRQEELF